MGARRSPARRPDRRGSAGRHPRWRRGRVGRGEQQQRRLSHDIGDSRQHRTTLTVVGNVDPVSDAAASFQVGGQVTSVTSTPGQQSRPDRPSGRWTTTALSETVSSDESTLNADEAKLIEDEENESSYGLVRPRRATAEDAKSRHRPPRPRRALTLGNEWLERYQRDDHRRPDDPHPGRVDAVDRPTEGSGRPDPGADRLHLDQYQHADRAGHLRGGPRDRPVRRAAGVQGPVDCVEGRDRAGPGARGRVVGGLSLHGSGGTPGTGQFGLLLHRERPRGATVSGDFTGNDRQHRSGNRARGTGSSGATGRTPPVEVHRKTPTRPSRSPRTRPTSTRPRRS